MTVSVILYCYKNESYLEHCLVTLQEQKKDLDFELIVVCDGFAPLLEGKVRQHFPNAQIIQTRFVIGRLASFLFGLNLSHNQYCVFQYAWDFNLAERLAYQARILSTFKLSACICNYKQLLNSGVRDENLQEQEFEILSQKGVQSILLEIFPLSTIMFNKTFIDYKYFLKMQKENSSFETTNLILQKTVLGDCFCVCNKKLMVVNTRDDVVFAEKVHQKALKKYLVKEELDDV